MIKKAILLVSIACEVVNAQVITQNFGTGANAFSIDFVKIGNPGNAPDTTGNPNPAGSVSYIYNIGKYEISRDMIDKANLAGALGITMYDMASFGGNLANRPATGITWYEAAKYVNYLNTSSGSAAAYKINASGILQPWSFSESGYNEKNQFRNNLAKFFLPTLDEWYKAAYGSPSGDWYDWPTASNSTPTSVAGGTNANTAVYGQSASAGPADISNAGGLSAWGTMGQGGNVFELLEDKDTTGDIHLERGGAWNGMSFYLNATESSYWIDSNGELPIIGFRVAMIPEPSAFSLLAVGLGGLALVRRRRS
jgi:hypothetical protein